MPSIAPQTGLDLTSLRQALDDSCTQPNEEEHLANLQKALRNSCTQLDEEETYKGFCRKLNLGSARVDSGIDSLLEEVATAVTGYLIIKIFGFLQSCQKVQYAQLWTDAMIESWIETSEHRSGLQYRKPLEYKDNTEPLILGRYRQKDTQTLNGIMTRKDRARHSLEEHLDRDRKGKSHLISEPKRIKQDMVKWALSWDRLMNLCKNDWDERIKPKMLCLLRDKHNIRALQGSFDEDNVCSKHTVDGGDTSGGMPASLDDSSKSFRTRFLLVLRSDLSDDNYGKVVLC